MVTKRERSTWLKAIAVGLIGGAFLPDSLNPYVLVRGIVAKAKGA